MPYPQPPVSSPVSSHTLLKPQPLKSGDTIAVISPAAPTLPPPAASGEKDAFARGMELLQSEGFQIKLMPNARNKDGYLAGSDEGRLADLHAAFLDPHIKAILCARGGYGCMRLLPDLDFDVVRNNPKIFIGFSDVTSLLIPFYQRVGLVGFYGPMLTSNLSNGEPYSQAELFRLLRSPLAIPHIIPNRDRYYGYRKGVAEGRLIGGNLSLLTALCGTSFQPDTRDHILFIEDWKEQYYTLDRQFQQLRMAGLFDHVRGVILCDFSQIETEPDRELPDFLKSLTDFLKVPVGYGFSVGHGDETATLPMGCKARFDSEAGTLALMESPTG